jgi:hypothetical protein
VAKQWACIIEGKTVRVQSIPALELEDIAKAAGLTWGDVQYTPLKSAAGAVAVYERCCREVGATPKPNISAEDLIGVYELVDDDLPNEYEDGLPVEGKAEPSTGGSS